MKKRSIGLFAWAWGAAFALFAQTEPVAITGLWNREGSAPNTFAAFRLANEAGIRTTEIDIRMSADSVVVVGHDAAYPLPDGSRATVEQAPAAVLERVVLANGEPMCRLVDFLKRARKERGGRLIVELKCDGDSLFRRKMVRETLRAVRAAKMMKRVEFISFDLSVVNALIEGGKEVRVSYLGGDKSPAELKAMGCSGLSYNVDLLRAWPECISEAKELGLTVNSWIVDKKEDMLWLIDRGVNRITTNHPCECRELIAASKAD